MRLECHKQKQRATVRPPLRVSDNATLFFPLKPHNRGTEILPPLKPVVNSDFEPFCHQFRPILSAPFPLAIKVVRPVALPTFGHQLNTKFP
jgi:hypothetical protein